MTEKYDFIIIGGGIFGIYTALFLARQGLKVCIIEKEKALLKKASIVNQARLHSGYHYPRSVATALMSDENKARFTKDHSSFINFKFEKYYGIEKFGSFTDSQQFKRFCDYLQIQCDPVNDHPLFNYHRLEALFKTTEYTFDPILIADYYRTLIQDFPKLIIVKLSHEVKAVSSDKDNWYVQVRSHTLDKNYEIQAPQVVNATYAGSNTINRLFEARNLELTHEISEMAFVSSPQFKNIGLTVMDGQFGSLMPYGLSGLLSLSSVAYTHHKISYESEPHFNCMDQHPSCRPDYVGICNDCSQKPRSNNQKMIAQIRNYFSTHIQFDYFFSYFTIKSKLKANYIDDGRPTEIAILKEAPYYYCIFAGKINSIYEIEKTIKL